MALRIIIFALSAIAFAGALLVFEAASRTHLALAMTEDALASGSPNVRAQLLERAETSLRSSWAQPLSWHAGAAEALSGILFVKAQAGDESARLAESAAWAVKAIELAPVQPHAWTRLAALALEGHPNRLCDASTCLAQSYALAAMTDAETECARLRIAHQLGELNSADPRLDIYMSAPGVSRHVAASCLNFLAPEELFEVLARQRR